MDGENVILKMSASHLYMPIKVFCTWYECARTPIIMVDKQVVSLWSIIFYLLKYLQFNLTFLLHPSGEVPEYDVCCTAPESTTQAVLTLLRMEILDKTRANILYSSSNNK